MLTLTHCTLSGNSAYYGGAIGNEGFLTSFTLTNSIVAGNTASGGGADIYNNSGTFTRAGANIIQALTNGSGGTDRGPAAINATPLVSPLANNGGPTWTMALKMGSPALDAVPAGSVIPGLTTDQRGFSRIRDGNAIAGALPDIGAYEAQTAPALGPEQIVVTTAMDENDPAGTLGNGISLREAVREVAPGSGITFDPSVFTAGAHTIILDAAKGEITLTRSTAIDATPLPAGVTVDGGSGANRIFYVPAGPVSLLGLTLTGGNGGGLVNNSGGGAIFNHGILNLTGCTVAGNSGGFSGAIFNQGTLTLTRCTLSANSSASSGGAIDNPGTLALTYCTLSGNSTTGNGGVIHSQGPLTLTHCTVAGNSAGVFGGAIYNFNSTMTLTNSIVAGNSAAAGQGADIFNDNSTITRAGASLVQALTNYRGGALDGSGTVSTAAPLLAALSGYGGPTQTMALRPGSPARNAAVGSSATSDQRGFPIVATADIGAYEAGTLINCPVYVVESLPAAATAAQLAPSFDFDGDGATNQDEWNALTDPANPASVLRITRVLRSDGILAMTFPSVTGRKYTLWSSDALVTWTNTGLPFITGNGSDRTFTLPLPGAGIARRFYRVHVSP